MNAFYPLSFGHIFNLIFVLALLYLLWLTFKKNKLSAVLVLGLYILMWVIMHFINQSDNKYSDVSHGLFGSWNAPLWGICLLAAVGLQLYALLPRRKKPSLNKS